MGENQEENAIVTSTGEYVVAWDFKKVKKGYLDRYHIKKYVLSTSTLTPLSVCLWFVRFQIRRPCGARQLQVRRRQGDRTSQFYLRNLRKSRKGGTVC